MLSRVLVSRFSQSTLSTFRVNRIDTNGVRYEMRRNLSKEQAEKVVEEFENKTEGHHVGYEIERMKAQTRLEPKK
jgi:hypothetical protein